jgi:hypothetical protein
VSPCNNPAVTLSWPYISPLRRTSSHDGTLPLRTELRSQRAPRNAGYGKRHGNGTHPMRDLVSRFW